MTSNAVGITLQYALELPSAARRGLGLRRVSCVAHSDDKPSRAVARRVGLKEGGTLRWEFVLHEGAVRKGMGYRFGLGTRRVDMAYLFAGPENMYRD